jgi:hypothetical protein
MKRFVCDLCKSDLPNGFVPVKIRIEDQMHEFCPECYQQLKTLLQGTGEEIITPSFVPKTPAEMAEDLAPFFEKPTYPMTPPPWQKYPVDTWDITKPHITWRDSTSMTSSFDGPDVSMYRNFLQPDPV